MTTVTTRWLTEEQVGSYHRNGYVAIRHVIDGVRLAELLSHGLVHHLVAHVCFADVGQRGIAGQEQSHREGNHRDEEEHRHEVGDPSQDVVGQVKLPRP